MRSGGNSVRAWNGRWDGGKARLGGASVPQGRAGVTNCLSAGPALREPTALPRDPGCDSNSGRAAEWHCPARARADASPAPGREVRSIETVRARYPLQWVPPARGDCIAPPECVVGNSAFSPGTGSSTAAISPVANERHAGLSTPSGRFISSSGRRGRAARRRSSIRAGGSSCGTSSFERPHGTGCVL